MIYVLRPCRKKSKIACYFFSFAKQDIKNTLTKNNKIVLFCRPDHRCILNSSFGIALPNLCNIRKPYPTKNFWRWYDHIHAMHIRWILRKFDIFSSAKEKCSQNLDCFLLLHIMLTLKKIHRRSKNHWFIMLFFKLTSLSPVLKHFIFKVSPNSFFTFFFF